MKYGCIGKTLGHSFSAEIHEMLGRYPYELREVPETELSAFLTRRDFLGVNVTIPYKEAVLPYLDHISDRAAAVGAVNTVVNRNGRLYGYNTDFGGMAALICRMGLELRGKKVLILGTGGTSKTARAVAEHLGAKEILSVSRTGRHGAATYDEALRFHRNAQIIINTTPCGMAPDVDGCPLELTPFSSLQGVVDAVYNPLATRLVLSVRQRGVPAHGGLYMLAAQAVLSARLFTGTDIDEDAAERIYTALLRSRRNLVLIGMPGSGKSTVGAACARIMGREWIDLDQEVEALAGRSVPVIFAQDGEAVFRDWESKAVQMAALRHGAVIATGGGSILREDNIRRLRQNGTLVWLDRPPAQLCPSDDRPLSRTAAQLRALYDRRVPLYRHAAHITVSVTGDVAQTAAAVVRQFNEEMIP